MRIRCNYSGFLISNHCYHHYKLISTHLNLRLLLELDLMLISGIPIQECSDLKMKNVVNIYPFSYPQTKGDVIIYDLILNMIRRKYQFKIPSNQNIFNFY